MDEDKDPHMLLAFQHSLFKILQDRGHYLKGIMFFELRTREKNRFLQYSREAWSKMMEFENI